MNSDLKQLLTRWQSLENEGALQRAALIVRALWLVGLILALIVGGAVIYKLHPAMVAAAATALGWIIAETNALRTRLEQWPVIKTYIDWKRVYDDLRT